jgi:Mn2+/Fe2+ NRAMP family transporter
MKKFVNPQWVKWLGWGVAVLITVLNLWLLAQIFKEWWMK